MIGNENYNIEIHVLFSLFEEIQHFLPRKFKFIELTEVMTPKNQQQTFTIIITYCVRLTV